MLTLNFDPFPVLDTERLILRRIVPADAAALFKLRTDERVLKYLLREGPKSMGEIYKFIELVDENLSQHNAICWGMELKEQPGPLFGNIVLQNIRKGHYRAEVGYSMLPDYFGKGLMNEALQKVLEYGFQTMKLHSVEAILDPGNDESRKLLERNGFVKEGHFKEDYYYKGKFYDSFLYSLINPNDHAQRD
jgi:ribosomal-protein-alanine N-acetyltransferase